MSDDRPDIQTREDCERLVRAFYGRALHDPLIGWIFTDVAKLDLEEHVPTITSFWETMLLGGRSYLGGGAFAPHADLHFRSGGLRKPHFERWLMLWRTSVDELFVGPHRGGQGPRAARRRRIPQPVADAADGRGCRGAGVAERPDASPNTGPRPDRA